MILSFNFWEPRFIILSLAYLCGMFLTAEVVTRKLTGKPCSQLGTTGNPGMANVMAHLGFKAGITVLIGDIVKSLIAVVSAVYFFYGQANGHPFWSYLGHFQGQHSYSLGQISLYYAILGVTLGHNYPLWLKFKGGKGVVTSCVGYFILSPFYGLIAMLIGMVTVFISQYLALGAVVITLVFTGYAFVALGSEAGIITLLLALIMVSRNFRALKQIPQGTAEKNDVLGAIRQKLIALTAINRTKKS